MDDPPFEVSMSEDQWLAGFPAPRRNSQSWYGLRGP